MEISVRQKLLLDDWIGLWTLGNAIFNFRRGSDGYNFLLPITFMSVYLNKSRQ